MRQRRVGTLTLGVALILIGIIIPIGLFSNYSVANLLKFSPIILVALGGEVLYYAIRYKDEKLKYDGLSIFMVVAITFITLVTSTVAPIVNNAVEYNREFHKQREELYVNLEDASSDLIDYEKQFHVFDYTDYYGRGFNDVFLNENERRYEFQCNINFYQNDKVLTKEESVKAIADFVKGLDGKTDNIGCMNIRVEHKNGSYFIEVPQRRLKDLSAEWVSKIIDTQTNEEEIQ